jgi:hyperosmotically inducible protein
MVLTTSASHTLELMRRFEMHQSLLVVSMTAALALAACERTNEPRDIGSSPSRSMPGPTSEAPTPPEQRIESKIEDIAITGKVKAALATADGLNDSSIKVETIDGRVTLSGRLADDAQRTRAIETVRRVEGVRGVDSRLEVGQG